MCIVVEQTRACRTCGADLPKQAGRGRRRLYCSDDCVASKNKMLKPLSCDSCGSAIEREGGSRRPKKYCSTECRESARRQKRRLSADDPLTCRGCGSAITAGRRRSYCTAECRSHHYDSRSYHLQCKTCGEQFESKSQNRKYCGKTCKTAALSSRPTLTCKHCLRSFKKKRGKGIYCSRECAFADQEAWIRGDANMDTQSLMSKVRARLLGWSKPVCRYTMQPVSGMGMLSEEGKAIQKHQTRRPRVAQHCESCGEFFSRAAARVGQVECRRCADRRNRRKQRRNPNNLAKSNHRKRARSYGVEYKPFKRSDVLKRDGHVCQLCGIKCKHRIKGLHYHDEYATLDHIVPLARGGPHTEGNAWCLCSGCNSEKADSGPLAWQERGGRVVPVAWPARVARLQRRAAATEDVLVEFRFAPAAPITPPGRAALASGGVGK